MKTINRIICSLLLAGACTLGAVAQENQSYFLHTIEKRTKSLLHRQHVRRQPVGHHQTEPRQ